MVWREWAWLMPSPVFLVAVNETVAHYPRCMLEATELQVYGCVRVRSRACRVAADEA